MLGVVSWISQESKCLEYNYTKLPFSPDLNCLGKLWNVPSVILSNMQHITSNMQNGMLFFVFGIDYEHQVMMICPHFSCLLQQQWGNNTITQAPVEGSWRVWINRCLTTLNNNKAQTERERAIKFIGLFGDRGHRGPYSPYKPCNHNLYIGIIIFPHIDNPQSTGYN